MNKVVLICTDRYPNGDAGAVRVESFAKLFKKIGYEPFVIGMGNSPFMTGQNKDDIPYISLRHEQQDTLKKVADRLFFIQRVKKLLKTMCLKKDDVIFFETTMDMFANVIKKYAIKNNIQIIFDSVEWFSPEQFENGEKSLAYKINDNLNTNIIDKSVKVVAISTYLEEYFKQKGIEVVRIPVMMDINDIPCNKTTDPQKIVFTYAGSPGKKDYLKEIIKGFAMAKENTDKPFEVRIIGVNKSQLIGLCECDKEDIEKLGNKLKCIGRVDRKEVLKHLSETDFTVLLRSESQRYAKAGFPTKFVESLATATPVIGNITSDIGMYLEDEKNGFIVSYCSAKELASSLEKVFELSFEDRRKMYACARETAVDCFEYRKFTEKFEKLFKLSS